MSASASKRKRKELSEQGLAPKDVAQQKAKEKRNKTIRNVCIFALAAIVCLGAIIGLLKYLQNRKYAPDYDVSKPVATIGDESVSVPVYNHFYNMSATNFYNMYSFIVKANVPFSQQSMGDSTLEDLLISNNNNTLQTVYNIYIKAKSVGYELSDEDKTNIQNSLKSLDTEAETYGYKNVDQYLSARFGRGCTKKSYEEFLNVYFTYSGYLAKEQEEFSPSEAELNAKYLEDKTVYDFVTFTYATTAAEADSEKKDENNEATYTDESKEKAKQDAEALKENMPESATTVSYQKANAVSNLTQEIADWLFDDARKEGDVEVFARDEKNTYFFTVRFDSRDDNVYNLANAYLISITKDTKEVEEGKETAEQKYQKLCDGVTADMTEEEFKKHVTDLGYSANSGSYARTTSIKGLADFLYDASRKEGDFTKLESDTAYYLVRFVGKEEDTYRNMLIKQTL